MNDEPLPLPQLPLPQLPVPLPLRVVKLGGSLLSTHNWPARVRSWTESQSLARTLWLVGGGAPVDSLRDLAAITHYDLEFLHWQCIDLMAVSCRLASHQLPDWPVLNSSNELRKWLMRKVIADNALVQVASFYRRDNLAQQPIDLPLNWDTTSDSLAALLAHVVGADECVLMKSCAIEHVSDWARLAEHGIVDRAFPLAVRGLKHVRLAEC